jgi:hypothetical protein
MESFENQYYVRFEIDGKLSDSYHIHQFIIHPEYEKNPNYDIAVLVLDKPVDNLDGLEPCYNFSNKESFYKDYQHLLTYVGYGVRRLYYDWFNFLDYKRRAVQAYTEYYGIAPKTLGAVRKVPLLKIA